MHFQFIGEMVIPTSIVNCESEVTLYGVYVFGDFFQIIKFLKLVSN